LDDESASTVSKPLPRLLINRRLLHARTERFAVFASRLLREGSGGIWREPVLLDKYCRERGKDRVSMGCDIAVAARLNAFAHLLHGECGEGEYNGAAGFRSA
jgi:hypothetical protein